MANLAFGMIQGIRSLHAQGVRGVGDFMLCVFRKVFCVDEEFFWGIHTQGVYFVYQSIIHCEVHKSMIISGTQISTKRLYAYKNNS